MLSPLSAMLALSTISSTRVQWFFVRLMSTQYSYWSTIWEPFRRSDVVLKSLESGPASRMASKPILGWGWCAMQKAWLMKPNQFPGFKSRHHAGSFSIHRYKWNTGFARFHRKYLLGTFFKQFFANIVSEKCFDKEPFMKIGFVETPGWWASQWC